MSAGKAAYALFRPRPSPGMSGSLQVGAIELECSSLSAPEHVIQPSLSNEFL